MKRIDRETLLVSCDLKMLALGVFPGWTGTGMAFQAWTFCFLLLLLGLLRVLCVPLSFTWLYMGRNIEMAEKREQLF